MSQFWMITYDISDDKKRRLIAEILANFGERVQYSVFECRLSQSAQMDLALKLEEVLGPEDHLRWYPLCKWCREAVFQQGSGRPSEDEKFFIL